MLTMDPDSRHVPLAGAPDFHLEHELSLRQGSCNLNVFRTMSQGVGKTDSTLQFSKVPFSTAWYLIHYWYWYTIECGMKGSQMTV